LRGRHGDTEFRHVPGKQLVGGVADLELGDGGVHLPYRIRRSPTSEQVLNGRGHLGGTVVPGHETGVEEPGGRGERRRRGEGGHPFVR
jgi:hypothetical protein